MSDPLDALILAAAKSRWQKVARIAGEVEGRLEDIGQTVEDRRITERIQALADAGQLESKGDISHWRYSEVRLPEPEH